MPAAPKHLIDRRIWRLSFLITGNELAAADLVDRVRRAQDVQDLDPSRLDRLIIQQAREMLGTAAGPMHTARRRVALSPLAAGADPAAVELFKRLQSLPEQPREAWVLARIDELDDLHVSRAMDCSKTATHNHLTAAEDHLRNELKDGYDAALAALRRFADYLDPGSIISTRRAQRRAQRIRRAGIITVLVTMAILIAALFWLKGWLG